MAKIRGFAILGLLRYLKHARPDGGIPAVVSALSGEAAETFAQPIQRGTWYPYGAYRDLLREVDEQLGDGERSLMYEVGRFTSRHEGETMIELFSGRSTVELLLKSSASLWEAYCDTGRFVTLEVASERLVAELRGFPAVSAHHCRLLVGWIEGMGLAAGAQTCRVEKNRCVHRGDDCCGYRVLWTRRPEDPK